jgi:hypothetical protein
VAEDTSDQAQTQPKAADSVALFVDANQYLSLYGLVSGRKLLDLLGGQRDRVFVPTQTVDEVDRNKLKLACRFFAEQTSKGKIVAVPDHLLGLPATQLEALRRKFKDAESARQEIVTLAGDLLEKISRSEDDVSVFLQSLFSGAIAPTATQLERARVRRERGNSPGKPDDPLGDQICWEQLIDHCRDCKCKEIWIVTGDKDYHVSFNGKLLLNPLLNKELVAACGGQPNVHCFDNLSDALTEFGKKMGVASDKLPTPDEAKQIKEEFDYWNANTVDKSIGVIFDASLQRIMAIPRANSAWIVNEAFWVGPPKDHKATSGSN